MFAYPINLIFEPRNSQSFYPRTRNFYQPSRPCSYHAVPPYSPYNYYDYDDENEDQLLQQLEQQEERDEHEEREQQAQQQEGSTFTTNHQPRRSFKVKIQGSDDEIKSTINKSQAAHKIFNFIKNQKANKQTRKILNKLHILRVIEDELTEVRKTKYVGNLTFDEEHEEKVLPISIENKRFLEYEYKTVKLLDKLDGIQSEGIDIIRERRKSLVKFVQTSLTELDNEKEKQWKEWKKLNENPNVIPVPSSVVSENDSEEPISTLSTELNNMDIEIEDNSNTFNENLMDSSNDSNENLMDSSNDSNENQIDASNDSNENQIDISNDSNENQLI